MTQAKRKQAPSNSVEGKKSMPTASVRVHLAGEDIVALCDNGSGGIGVGVIF